MKDPWLTHVDADTRILQNIRQEVPPMIPGMQVQEISEFVNVHERNHIGPAGSIRRSDAGHTLPTKELTGLVIRHLAVTSHHPTAM